jgi:hypothetical protein
MATRVPTNDIVREQSTRRPMDISRKIVSPSYKNGITYQGYVDKLCKSLGDLKVKVSFDETDKDEVLCLDGWVYVHKCEITKRKGLKGEYNVPGFFASFGKIIPQTRDEPEDMDIIDVTECPSIHLAIIEALKVIVGNMLDIKGSDFLGYEY